MTQKRKFGILVLLISILLIISDFQKTKIIEKENLSQIENFFTEQEINPRKEEKKESYLGILEIPSISLKRGFYSFHSKNNTVEKNIELISKNCNPNENCSFILASHSGTSNIAYFKHLDRLKINDTAILYFQNKKLEYTLEKIEHQEKNGTISLFVPSSPELVLTTCNKIKDNVQDLYIFKPKK